MPLSLIAAMIVVLIAMLLPAFQLCQGRPETSKVAAPACATDYELDDAEDRWLGDSQLAPIYHEGRMFGFRFQGVDSGSAIARAGILPGDVILSIDETPLSATELTSYVYCVFATNPSFSIVVQRSTGQSEAIKLSLPHNKRMQTDEPRPSPYRTPPP